MSDREGVFSSLDKRKQAVKEESLQEEQDYLENQNLQQQQLINQLEDSDMPTIESLNEDSDYSKFMSEKVSPALRKQALRKLFLSSKINVLDGLNEYDENYTFFESLGDIIPYDLKQELKRQAEQIREQTKQEQQKTTKETSVELTDTHQETNDNTSRKESSSTATSDTSIKRNLD